MRMILKILSFVGLILTIVPSVLVFANIIELSTHKNLMLLGTVLWFMTAPFWLNKKKQNGLVNFEQFSKHSFKVK